MRGKCPPCLAPGECLFSPTEEREGDKAIGGITAYPGAITEENTASASWFTNTQQPAGWCGVSAPPRKGVWGPLVFEGQDRALTVTLMGATDLTMCPHTGMEEEPLSVTP